MSNSNPLDYPQIFAEITADPRYLQNLDWGKPRSGHPEGTVRAHIAELERNLEHLANRCSEEEVCKLRILIHVHDTFKADALAGVGITNQRSHASLARRYLAEYCGDADLLAMVQYHDEPFALWRQLHRPQGINSQRLESLRQNIGDWDLFLAFLIIDGCTAGKSREPLRWFLSQILNSISSRWSTADLID